LGAVDFSLLSSVKIKSSSTSFKEISISSKISKISSSILNFPDSIFERSRISLIILRRFSEESWI